MKMSNTWRKSSLYILFQIFNIYGFSFVLFLQTLDQTLNLCPFTSVVLPALPVWTKDKELLTFFFSLPSEVFWVSSSRKFCFWFPLARNWPKGMFLGEQVLMCQERFHDTLKEVPPVKAKVGVMLYTWIIPLCQIYFVTYATTGTQF